MDREGREALELVAGFADAGLTGATHTEDFRVVIDAQLPAWSEIGEDQIEVKQLDVRNIGVIASVLGQSVALDHYVSDVDQMLHVLNGLNKEMAKTGTFNLGKKDLFQLVARNNITMGAIITQLGLLERSDTAWKYAQYSEVWEVMRHEFEMEDRFEALSTKVSSPRPRPSPPRGSDAGTLFYLRNP